MCHLLGWLLLAWLLAEAVASVRPRHAAVRTASLVRRGWRGLVPAWAVALHIGLTSAAVVFAALCLSTGIGQPVGWYLIAVAGIAVVVVYGIGWLAVLRPASADDGVDGALRMRSGAAGRVACRCWGESVVFVGKGFACAGVVGRCRAVATGA